MTAQFLPVDDFQGRSGYVNATLLVRSTLISGDPLEVNGVFSLGNGMAEIYEPDAGSDQPTGIATFTGVNSESYLINSEQVIAFLENDPDAIGTRTLMIMQGLDPFNVRGTVAETLATFENSLAGPDVGSYTGTVSSPTGNATFTLPSDVQYWATGSGDDPDVYNTGFTLSITGAGDPGGHDGSARIDLPRDWTIAEASSWSVVSYNDDPPVGAAWGVDVALVDDGGTSFLEVTAKSAETAAVAAFTVGVSVTITHVAA